MGKFDSGLRTSIELTWLIVPEYRKNYSTVRRSAIQAYLRLGRSVEPCTSPMPLAEMQGADLSDSELFLNSRPWNSYSTFLWSALFNHSGVIGLARAREK